MKSSYLEKGKLSRNEAVDEIRDKHGKDATSWMVSLFREEH